MAEDDNSLFGNTCAGVPPCRHGTRSSVTVAGNGTCSRECSGTAVGTVLGGVRGCGACGSTLSQWAPQCREPQHPSDDKLREPVPGVFPCLTSHGSTPTAAQHAAARLSLTQEHGTASPSMTKDVKQRPGASLLRDTCLWCHHGNGGGGGAACVWCAGNTGTAVPR